MDQMTDKPQVIVATLVKVTKSLDVHDSKHVAMFNKPADFTTN
jgi:hypothetical protein